MNASLICDFVFQRFSDGIASAMRRRFQDFVYCVPPGILRTSEQHAQTVCARSSMVVATTFETAPVVIDWHVLNNGPTQGVA